MSNLISFESLLWETADKGFEKCVEYSTKLCEKYNIELDTSYWTKDNYIPKLANFISSLSEDYLQEKKKKKKPYSSRRDGMFDPDLGVKMFNRAAGTDSSSDGSSGTASGGGDSGGDGGGMSEALLDEAEINGVWVPDNVAYQINTQKQAEQKQQEEQAAQQAKQEAEDKAKQEKEREQKEQEKREKAEKEKNEKDSTQKYGQARLLGLIDKIKSIDSGNEEAPKSGNNSLEFYKKRLRTVFSETCKNKFCSEDAKQDRAWQLIENILLKQDSPLSNQFVIFTQETIPPSVTMDDNAVENYKSLYDMWVQGDVSRKLDGKIGTITNFYKQPELWSRNLQDFQYTVRILDVASHPDKLKQFFDDPSNIKPQYLLDNKKIKDAGINKFAMDASTKIGVNIYSVVKQWDNSNAPAKKKTEQRKKYDTMNKFLDAIISGNFADMKDITDTAKKIKGGTT